MFGGRVGITELIVLMVALVFLALFIFAWSKVFEKAGFAPLLCLLMLVPGVSLLTFFWFAFAKWPIRRQLSSGHSAGPEN